MSEHAPKPRVVEVEMLAFGNGKIRQVEIPVAEWKKSKTIEDRLELVFRYGQNDFQDKPLPSVSCGDVARIDGKRFLCEPVGWQELMPGESPMPEREIPD